MKGIFTVVDQYGYIASFTNLQNAEKLLEEFRDVNLFIMHFPIDDSHQKDEVYFIPYLGNNSVALVTNNKKYAKNIQVQLLRLNLTYPDDIKYYTRLVDKIHELEYKRLIDPEFKHKVEIFDEALMKYEKMVETDPFKAGMPLEQYYILDEEYGCIQRDPEKPSDKQTISKSDSRDTNCGEKSDETENPPPAPPSTPAPSPKSLRVDPTVDLVSPLPDEEEFHSLTQSPPRPPSQNQDADILTQTQGDTPECHPDDV